MKLLLLLTCTLFLLQPSWSKELELKRQNKSLYIKEISGWELKKDLFGIPFVYFSPSLNSQRSNISFVDTGAEVELDIKTLSQNQKDYQEGRKKWAQTVQASIVEFRPYRSFKSKKGHQVHQVGFSYKHQKKSYVETSHYIECKGKIIFSKSLRLKENSQHQKDFEDLINSLDCSGV